MQRKSISPAACALQISDLEVGYARASFREKEGGRQAAGADDGALVSMMQQHVRRQDPDCTSKNRVRRQENM
jgi:hypothetical protein